MSEENAAIEEEPSSTGTQHHEMSDEEFAKATRRRIGKEVKKRKVLIESHNETLTKAKQETAKWRRAAEEAEERFETAEADRIERINKENQSLLKQALEDDDTGEQARLMEEMAVSHTKSREHEQRKEAREARAKEEKEEEDKLPPNTESETDTDSEPQPIHASAEAFIARNEWFNKNSKARERAIEIEADLRKNEGFEIGDDLYDELESKLSEEMPDLDIGIEDEPGGEPEDEPGGEPEDDPPPKKETGPPAVAHSSRGEGRHQQRRSKGDHMSKEAKATMKTYGLDPENADDIKGFLKHRKGM